MANDSGQTAFLDPRVIWRAIVANWRVIVTAASIGLSLAALWTFIQQKEYTAESTAIVFTGSSSSAGQGAQADQFAKTKATQYKTLAESSVVVNRAYELAKLTPGGTVGVAVPLDTPQIKIRVVRNNPHDAASLANAYIESLAGAVQRIENGTVDGSPQVGLPSIVKIQTFVPAVAPSIPSSPRVKLALALGLLLGLMAGLGAAAMRSILDRRIRSDRVIEEQFGVSVVGLIPIHTRQEGQRRLAGVESRAIGGEGFRTVEAFKELRTNLQFMNPDHPPRVIAVTSPLPEEGKSTVALNLAVTIASRGQKVVLVDGDLRRPTVAKSFGFPEGVGLTDVIVGNAALEEVISDVPETPGMRVLGCGPIPPNPSEILSSERFGTLLRDLAKDAMVIVDAPPLIPVTDAAIIAARFDGALIVIQAGRTNRDQLAKALSNLAKVKAPVLGAVLNRVPGGRASSYSYGGYYYDNYYYEPATPTGASAKSKTAKKRTKSGGSEYEVVSGAARERGREDAES